ESLVALNVARTMILPAAYRYQGELAATAANIKEVTGKAPHMGTLEALTKLVASLEEKTGKLEEAIGHKGSKDIMAEGKHFRDDVVPAMLEVRKVADELEGIVADDLWPLPTYREMLFIK